MVVLNRVFCGLDTIHITITRPRSAIAFYGETPEPTDKLFYGVLDILLGKNFVVMGGSKKFVNNGSEYIQSNSKEILIQLRSAHLMKYGRSKVNAIINFLHENEVKPKPKRNRKKDATKTERPLFFYQITRFDATSDYETNFDLVKILSEKIGYTRFFTGIPKSYSYRVIHENKRLPNGQRDHKIKEIKIYNKGWELAIYNKKLEVAEQATAEKLKLYPEIYREILINPTRQLFRVELRLFRSRSVALNDFNTDQLFEAVKAELIKFGKTVQLLKIKNKKSVESLLFSKLFDFSASI